MANLSVRDRVLSAAVDQFHRLGFNGSSVDDITSLAGVPKGSFYNHFKSKEILAVEVLQQFASERPQSILINKDLSPVKRIKKYFDTMAEEFTKSGFKRGCLLGNFSNEMSDHSDLVQAKLDSLFIAWSKLLASVIQEAQTTGEIETSMKADQLAGFVISAWQGTLVRARATRSQGPLKDFKHILFHELLK